MAVEGSITIGIGANTDEFDKKIAELERKMQKEEDKKIEYKAEINLKEGQIQKAKEILERMPAEIDRVNTEMQELAIQMDSLKIDSPEFETAKQKLTELQIEAQVYQELWKTLPGEINKQEVKVENLKNKQEQINQKVAEYKQKIESVKMQKQVADVDKLKSSFNSVGSSIQNSIKSVARLALGVLGVRSAFMALRRASSDLAGYDKQYAANIEYIRYALTQAIAPVLRWIVQMAATLLGYLNAILQGWFGINLFSKGSAKNFAKMKAGASGVAKSVKEIKKQLAGFDEINMLTDQSDSGAGGGGAGGAMPDFDLSKMQGEPPAWLKWIIDNRDLILSILAGAIAGITALRLGLDGIKALGIGLLVAGIVYTIQSLIAYLNDPSWKNFGKILQGIGVALVGLGALIGSVPVAVAGAIVLIIGTITKYWEQIKAFFQKGIDWLKGKSDWVHQMFGDVIGNIYDLFTRTLQNLLGVFDSFFKMLKGVFDGIIKFIKDPSWNNFANILRSLAVLLGGVAAAMIAFNATNPVGWIMLAIAAVAGIASAVIKNWDTIKATLKKIGTWVNDNVIKPIKKFFSDLWKKLKEGASSTWKGIKNVFSKVGSFFKSVYKTIKKILGKEIEVNIHASAGGGKGSSGGGGGGGGYRAHGGIYYPSKLPKLASGGIINVPGRGVPYNGAIIGERGAEAVVPLTDRQQMELLGATIGKYININATIPVSVGNRQVAREIRKIQAEENFAFNQ